MVSSGLQPSRIRGPVVAGEILRAGLQDHPGAVFDVHVHVKQVPGEGASDNSPVEHVHPVRRGVDRHQLEQLRADADGDLGVRTQRILLRGSYSRAGSLDHYPFAVFTHHPSGMCGNSA